MQTDPMLKSAKKRLPKNVIFHTEQEETPLGPIPRLLGRNGALRRLPGATENDMEPAERRRRGAALESRTYLEPN